MSGLCTEKKYILYAIIYYKQRGRKFIDDKSIRSILISWIQANYSESRIYQEKSIGNSVCDLMLVTNCLTGFEIKSDIDNYNRLRVYVLDEQNFEKPYLNLKRLDTVYCLNLGISVTGNIRRIYNFFTKFSKQLELIENQTV